MKAPANTSNFPKAYSLSFGLLFLVASAGANAAPTQYGGWYTADSLVRTTAPFTNPESCPTTDGYVVISQDAGHDWFNSMLLSAYMGSRQVRFTIDGCSPTGRPHIIGIEILP